MRNWRETLRDLLEGMFYHENGGRNSLQLPMHATSVQTTSDPELIEALLTQAAEQQRTIHQLQSSLEKAMAERQEAFVRAADYLRQIEVAEAALKSNAQARNADKIKRELLLELFPLLNDLDRSFWAVPPELKDLRSFTSWYRGMLLNEKRLHKTLEEGWGLTPLASVGQDFDANLHEAVSVDAEANQPRGTIARIEYQGYALGNKVLQPARVVVSSNATILKDPKQA